MRTDAEPSRSFLVETAPDLICQSDNQCNETLCLVDGEQLDPDCVVCEVDEDCADSENQICDNGECVARPGLPGAIGAVCTVDGPQTCDNGGLCFRDESGPMCTRLCDPSEGCPTDFECVAAGEQNVCWPEAQDSGGCSSGSGSKGWAIAFFALALLGFRRRLT